MRTPRCPRCERYHLSRESNGVAALDGDVPAVRLVCACGYARWYHLIPTGRGQFDLVAITVPWPVWVAVAWLVGVALMVVLQ